LLLCSACAGETVTRPTNPSVDRVSLDSSADAGVATPQEHAAARTYLKALSSPSFVELTRLLHEDAHFAYAGVKNVHGRQDVVRIHEALLGSLDGRTFAARRILVTPTSQIVEWTMSATHRQTNKPVALKGVTLLWTTDDGTISDYHLYFDEALLAAQVGAGPKQLWSLPAPQPPSGEPETLEQARSAAESANAAVLRASLEALENRDETAYIGAMKDDVEITTLESASPMRGKADVRAWFKAMHKAVAHLDTSTDNTWAVGPYAVIEYRVAGEQRGPIGWVPAQKDNLLEMFFVDVVELDNGKLARVWRYDNLAQIQAVP
jgi:ketosteroid isomerase-like protein